MEKYLLLFLCRAGSDAETQLRCQVILKSTVQQFQIYQTIKEKETKYQGYAEKKLTKPGFWAASTVISSASTQKLFLSGHNIAGIDSVNLRIGRESELSLIWAF